MIWVFETILKIIQQFLVWKLSQINLMVLENFSGSKSWFFPSRFASGTVYRLLLYVFKVAMHAKSKRFQITRDICKFYLHLHRSTMFSILVWTIQSEISYIIYSLFYASPFFVVRFVVIFDRLTKHYSFWERFTATISDHTTVFQSLQAVTRDECKYIPSYVMQQK